MNETETSETEVSTTPETPTNEENGFQAEIPFIKNLLERIDTREVFTNGTNQVIRGITLLFLLLGSLVLLMAAFKSLTYDSSNSYMEMSGVTKFFAALIDLSVFAALFSTASIILQRTTQIKDMENPTVIKIYFSIIRMTVEVIAFNCVLYLFVFGFLQVLLGVDSGAAIQLAVMSIPDAIQALLPESPEFWVRFLGLFSIVASFIAGFMVLFAGYVYHDVLHTIYTFFKRK